MALYNSAPQNFPPNAPVVELVDTRDLKSLDLTVVPVRFRPGAPLKNMTTSLHRLYSFRRCPYAMRARLGLLFAELQVELRVTRSEERRVGKEGRYSWSRDLGWKEHNRS